MDSKLADQAFSENLLNEEEYNKIKEYYSKKNFTLHWELKIILYLGVTLLSTGIGFLIYMNIDTIGHQAILAIIASACAGCFIYCYKQRKPFSFDLVVAPTPLYDYLLLLGCLLFLTFEGYIQYQYNVFGERYGLVAIIPTVLFFFIAYYFDHRGVLSMAIAGLAGWLGINMTPKDFFQGDLYSDLSLINIGIGLGIFLVVVGIASEYYSIKKHFSFSYINFGGQALFIASLVGLVASYTKVGYVLLIILCTGFIWYARKEQSFYFLLISVIYGYWGMTYLFILTLDKTNADSAFLLGLLYFIASCGSIIYFFFNYKKILKKKDAGIQ